MDMNTIKNINKKIDNKIEDLKQAKNKVNALNNRIWNIANTIKKAEKLEPDMNVYSTYFINNNNGICDPYFTIDKYETKYGYKYCIKICNICGPGGYTIVFIPSLFRVKVKSYFRDLSLKDYKLFLDNFDAFEDHFYKVVDNKLSKI